MPTWAQSSSLLKLCGTPQCRNYILQLQHGLLLFVFYFFAELLIFSLYCFPDFIIFLCSFIAL